MPRSRIWLAAAGTSLPLFSLLAWAVSTGAATPFDLAIRSTIHGWSSSVLDVIASDTSLLGSVAVLAVLLGVAFGAFYLAGRRNSAIVLALTMGGAFALNSFLKILIHRPRPAAFVGGLPDSYSFPSGHAMYSCCFYITLAAIAAANVRDAMYRRTLLAIAALLVLAIGLSRIYLGVHYPTDVLGGYIAATFWLALVRSTILSFGLLPPGK